MENDFENILFFLRQTRQDWALLLRIYI